MQAELERAPKNQIIWFLAGKVELCKQQYRVIKSQISWVDVKLLTGEDNVDAWSTQAVWDAVLRDVRIVVSTDEVLRGAMQQNAFVKMEQLALIVFDEGSSSLSGRQLVETWLTYIPSPQLPRKVGVCKNNGDVQRAQAARQAGPAHHGPHGKSRHGLKSGRDEGS